jgi:hypothetical protein
MWRVLVTTSWRFSANHHQDTLTNAHKTEVKYSIIKMLGKCNDMALQLLKTILRGAGQASRYTPQRERKKYTLLFESVITILYVP